MPVSAAEHMVYLYDSTEVFIHSVLTTKFYYQVSIIVPLL